MYRYEDEREKLFTDDGQRLFLEIRDRTFGLLKIAGAARLEEMIKGSVGDSWRMLACVDRMVELSELVELIYPGSPAQGQNRVFVRGLR